MSAGVCAKPDVQALIAAVESGPDFRVRVQAALELGRLPPRTGVRKVLERALDDGHAAVRAAAAAALKVLGDPSAVPELEHHSLDSSPAVRAQIKASIAALRLGSDGSVALVPPTEVLVQFGDMKNGTGVASTSILGTLERASVKKLGNLPGVKVMTTLGYATALHRATAVGPAAASRRRQAAGAPAGVSRAENPQIDGVPTVLVTGRLSRLKRSRQGSAVVYSASVEYIMHQMPGQTIRGKITGSASAHGSATEIEDTEKMDELQREALEAAIDSALRRAPEALKAAIR